MAVQASVRSYLGIAKEVTKGTAVAPTAFIPVAQSKFKPVDVIDPLFDQAMRGSLAKTYNYIPGRTRSTVDFGGPVFPDTVPWAIAGLMGSVATVGASAPFSHTISLKNASAINAETSPTSFTITDFYAADVRAYAGCQISDFTLNFSADGLLEYDAKATGWLSTTASTPTPTFSTILPNPAWIGTVSIAGSTVAYSVDGSIKLSRSVTPVYGLSNTQNPFAIFPGALEATGSFTFIMETNAELTRYLTNTQPAIVVNFQQGAGATLTQIQATLTKGAYTAAAIDRGSEYVQIKVDLTGIGNTTDAGATLGFSPIKFVVQNAVASGTYQ